MQCQVEIKIIITTNKRIMNREFLSENFTVIGKIYDDKELLINTL